MDYYFRSGSLEVAPEMGTLMLMDPWEGALGRKQKKKVKQIRIRERCRERCGSSSVVFKMWSRDQ